MGRSRGVCWARHAGVCGSCSRVIPLPARRWNRPRRTRPFLCDATYPDNEQEAQAKQWGHSTFAQGAAIAKKAGVRRFWLMHYSPMILEPEAALPNAQAVFPAAECGFDGKQIILQYDEEAT